MSSAPQYSTDFTVTDVDFALTKRCCIGWMLKSPSYNCTKLVFIKSGAAKYVFENGDKFCAAKNDVVFFRPQKRYKSYAIGDETLEFTVIQLRVSDGEIPIETITTPQHPAQIYEQFKKIEDTMFFKGTCFKTMARSLVQILICAIIRGKAAANSMPDTASSGLKSAEEYIENYFTENITIETLSQISGYSVSHFRKKFKEMYGESPVKYLSDFRVEKAKDLLKSGLYTTDEIAKMCGFKNVYYFGRVFKKHCGHPPRTY